MRKLIYLLALCAPTMAAQCESIGISGTQSNFIMTIPTTGTPPDYWETTASDGTILNQDSNSDYAHFIFNTDLYNTIFTCMYYEDSFCCVEYFYEGDGNGYNGWVEVVNLPAQCDLSITSWDASTGDIVIEAINSLDCGCNELTDGNTTCNESASPHVNNNTTVSHLVLGLHSPGLEYNWGCTQTTFHPGWSFKVFTLYGNGVLESGESWSTNVYDSGASTNDCWSEMLANDTLCMELVIWQINLSRTANIWEGGWAANPSIANQTQNYPDQAPTISDNSVITCALPPCDTVYVDVDIIEYLTDTIVEYVEVVDTLYWYEYLTDTLYVTDTIIEYVDVEWITYDTITIIETEFVDVIIDNYVYITDTLTQFVSITTYIDCETGEDCGELSPCDETSIYAPNVVTPNNDGTNDTWQVIAQGGCWDQWDVRIYNRWGGLVWISTSNMDAWDADVATGVYVYTITAHSSTNANVFQFNGTVTVLY